MDNPETNARPKGLWLKPGLLALGAAVVLAGGFSIARAAGMGPALRCAHHGAMGHDFVEFRLTKALDKPDLAQRCGQTKHFEGAKVDAPPKK